MEVVFAVDEHMFAVHGHMFAGGEHKFAVHEYKIEGVTVTLLLQIKKGGRRDGRLPLRERKTLGLILVHGAKVGIKL